MRGRDGRRLIIFFYSRKVASSNRVWELVCKFLRAFKSPHADELFLSFIRTRERVSNNIITFDFLCLLWLMPLIILLLIFLLNKKSGERVSHTTFFCFVATLECRSISLKINHPFFFLFFTSFPHPLGSQMNPGRNVFFSSTIFLLGVASLKNEPPLHHLQLPRKKIHS